MSSVMAAKNTTGLLQRLRVLMKNSTYVSPSINAYIVPSEDAHFSEYIASCDARRAFISGFTGSYGVAVVTESKAALWTDGRYFLQASQQLDNNWTLMKMGLPDTPTQGKWLCSELPPNGRVGVDPNLMSQGVWQDLSEQLESCGHQLVSVQPNFIDLIWDDRPPSPSDKVFVHKLEFAGLTWQDKVAKLRAKMVEKKADILVISALDEIAWLLNLRGSDITFNPVFFSYCIITHDSVQLFIDNVKLSEEVRLHLNVTNTNNELKVTVKSYSVVVEELKLLVNKTASSANTKIWISPKSNHALFDVIPKLRQLKEFSPVEVLKSTKNEIELQGMKNCHVRDAAALCEFFSWLEKEVPKRNVSEIEAANYAEDCRKKQKDYVSLSFDTISSTGSDGAIIHYKPTPESDKVISPNELFLFDSGAQYHDGTTDVTRTIHLGQPSDYEKECFTLVLKGHIALDSAVFPNEVKGIALDTMARQYLWQAGLDYRHGTGHGVGSFLNVHEGPGGISPRSKPEDIPMKKGMIFSNEPGYYEDGKFGIRIESLFAVVEAHTKYNFQNVGFLTFETITFVPIQTKLINKSLLTEKEVQWVNEYHRKCRETVGPVLQQLEMNEAFQWLLRETEPL